MRLGRARFGLVVLVLAGTIGCDQVTKELARAKLTASEPVAVGGVLTLSLTENAGAFLSAGSRIPAEAQFWIFTVGIGACLLGALVYLFAAPGISRKTLLLGSLVVAGGLSNLLDRLVRGGRVTDFLVLHVGPLRTGVFNVADLAITAGALLLGFSFWMRSHPHPAQRRRTVDR